MSIVLQAPLTDAAIHPLRAGDKVKINGVIYAARDAVHKKLAQLLQAGEQLPLKLAGQIVYYAGPCPAKPGRAVGSIGPTTSGRMDIYTPALLEQGLKGMIGKGQRSVEVIDSMKKNKAVYFAAIGGAGALLATSVSEATIIAFPELGAEALYRLMVQDFPAIVAIDSRGNDLYKNASLNYK
ncbi:MAG: Fe-S-containing hydro-lyase [Firmicutes bacterium]|nr:Fe-S-containing hydro-lyase [Bacillota bacterium]